MFLYTNNVADCLLLIQPQFFMVYTNNKGNFFYK